MWSYKRILSYKPFFFLSSRGADSLRRRIKAERIKKTGIITLGKSTPATKRSRFFEPQQTLKDKLHCVKNSGSPQTAYGVRQKIKNIKEQRLLRKKRLLPQCSRWQFWGIAISFSVAAMTFLKSVTPECFYQGSRL